MVVAALVSVREASWSRNLGTSLPQPRPPAAPAAGLDAWRRGMLFLASVAKRRPPPFEDRREKPPGSPLRRLRLLLDRSRLASSIRRRSYSNRVKVVVVDRLL